MKREWQKDGMTAMVWALLMVAVLPLLTFADFPRGEVINPIISLRDNSKSYALYLPSRYDESRRWPILLCFDPGGRGGIPVSLFREAAEKYGWILAGSNNSRNGPWKDIYEAVWGLWEDARARLGIDDTRIYAAGFSGGARVACSLGRVLSIQTAGVIGCGGGLPDWLVAGDVTSTPWFGTVGRDDFNYREMRLLEKQLLKQGTPCLLKEFKGTHSWPPADLALEAVAWLNGLHAAPPIQAQE